MHDGTSFSTTAMEESDSARSRLPWALLLLPLIASAATRDLWAPDEPRYAEVARECWERGDFVVMHLCGQVYPDKPPLLFWLAGLAGRLAGWHELALRLVTLLSMAGTAWLVARFARRAWGSAEASWAPALFLGTVMVTEIGGRLQIDPLLCLLTTASLHVATRPARTRSDAARSALGAGLLAGLGALAKGPVAFVHTGLVLLVWRLAAPDRERPRVSRSALALALAAAVVPVAAWAAAAIAVEPTLLRPLLLGQHIGRVTTTTQHPGPIWKHLVNMPIQLLPWTVPAVLGLAAALRARFGRERSPERDPDLAHQELWFVRAGLWLLTLLVFFSLINAKRDLYLLPAYPAAALLAARWLVLAFRRGRAPSWIAWVGSGIVGVAGAALAVGGTVAQSLDPRLPDLTVAGLLAALPLLAAAGASLLAGPPAVNPTWARRLLLGWAAAGLILGLLVSPRIDRVKSPRALAESLAELPMRPSEIPCVAVHPEGYRFYGGVPTVRGAADELPAVLEREGEDFLALIREEAWLAMTPEEKSPFVVVQRANVGSRRVLVLGAAPARQDDAEASSAGG